MTNRLVGFVLSVTVFGAAPLDAQQIGVRFGAGPALAASTVGVASLVAVRGRTGPAILRLDARALLVGKNAQYTGTARTLYAGVAAGIGSTGARPGPRLYALGTAGLGGDLREGDAFGAFGGTVGFETPETLGLFGEVHYEHWSRRGAGWYYDLPRNNVSVVFGVHLN